MDRHRRGFLNDRPCEGRKSTMASTGHYSLVELKELAKTLGIERIHSFNKDALCQRIREHYMTAPAAVVAEAAAAAEPADAGVPLVVVPQAKPVPRIIGKIALPKKAPVKPVGDVEPNPGHVLLKGIGPFAIVTTYKGEPERNGYFVSGPTYDHKELLKKHGCRWNPARGMWWIPPASLQAVTDILEAGAAEAPAVTEETLKKYSSLTEIMDSLGVTDIRTLVKFKVGQLKTLVDTIMIHENGKALKDLAVDLDEAGQVRLLLDTLAGKLCRCIKKVKSQQSTTETSSIAICISSIFKRRNLQMHKFLCDDDGESGVLLPSSDGLILETK